MRIGLIAPWIPVPPPAYGGTEAVIDNLARGLAALAHDVRLFTVGESTCPVPRQWLYRSPAEPMGDPFHAPGLWSHRGKDAARVIRARPGRLSRASAAPMGSRHGRAQGGLRTLRPSKGPVSNGW
jgi:hypothetical protein